MDDMMRYLEEIVDPTVNDFANHPWSRRHAFLACVATFHAIDYLAFPRKRSSTLRQKFRSMCREFGIVDTVAHAFKHVVTGDRANPVRVEDVISRPPSFSGVAVAGRTFLGDTKGRVMLYREHSADLLWTVKQAVEFLRSPEVRHVAHELGLG